MRECPARYATPRTPGRRTLGTAAGRIAAQLGTPFMPWQQQVADVALELDERGKLAFREVILTVPRQSGKTTLLLALILTRALGAPKQNIRYGAQTGSDARKKWMDDWLPALKVSPFAELFKPRLTNGHEGLIFHNGSHQGLIAVTLKSGHGSTLDLGILDEAFAHPDARLEQALKPAMITRPQPQLWVVSTAGTPDASPYLWSKVESGREIAQAGLSHSVAYFEWSAADDLEAGDPQTWRSCMPALGRTVSEEAVASDFQSMDRPEFERAYLNRWRTVMTEPVIPLGAWKRLADPNSAPVDPVCFAFDVTPDRGRASIAVAGLREDGMTHLEVVEQGQGAQWVAPRIAELVERHHASGVWVDPAGPAGSLLPELSRLAVPVVTVSAKEHAQACGMLFDAVVADVSDVRHLGCPVLLAALDGASKRPLSDAWAWSRRNSGVDISPLVAVTLAFWGLRSGAGDGPGVWDLNELVASLRAGENPEPISVGPVPVSAGGQRFVPADQMPRRRGVFR